MDLVPGAHLEPGGGTTFVVLSTVSREVAVGLFDERGTKLRDEPLDPEGEGRFARTLPDVRAGALYKFVLDGDEVPDPFARFLPRGVHGPAEVMPSGREAALEAPRWPAVVYELHVGAFTPEGTYAAAAERLDHLARLGVTAIELLPVSAFPGARNWGYDGVAPFAPYAGYGRPEDLRAFVRAAHARGLAVVLDVVYNHLGPSGNYLGRYAPEYFTDAIPTPWGPAPDFAHGPMRRLALESARYWLTEFGFDGLRLDATHAIHDASPKHVLGELTDLAHALSPPRRVFFEDERNDPRVVTELGADAVWADDFHHQVHVLVTGERDGYYAAYEPTVAALARTIERGFAYTGEPYPPWKGRPRGAPARGLAPEQLVYCIQNHDQIGNRPFGRRLSDTADLDAYAAASALLLFLPMTPLLFMGQEWAASSPFLFFSDHEADLGRAISEGRRREFASFEGFGGPNAAEIPDPQDRATFERSKLDWSERDSGAHARVLALYRDMLRLRREDEVLSERSGWDALSASARGAALEVVRRGRRGQRKLVASFGPGETQVVVEPGDRVLLSTGGYRGGALSRGGVVVIARG